MLADALWSDARRRTASRPVATTHKTFTKPSSCFYVFKVKIQLTRVRIIVNKINRVDARILTMFSRVTLGTKGHQRSPFGDAWRPETPSVAPLSTLLDAPATTTTTRERRTNNDG